MKALHVILVLSSWILADVSPQQILAKTCLAYYHSYEGQPKHKAFVYAREKETGKDRCNWAYGYPNVKEAIDSAMKGCQSVVLDAECILLYTDGVFNVKEGVFSLLEPIDDTPLKEKEKKSLESDAKKVIRGNCLPFFTKNYLDAKGHKSFAYSVDTNGNYACGYAYENQTKQISQKRAIASCEENKVKRGDKKPISPCKVYASAHKIFLKLNDFNIKNTVNTFEHALHKGNIEKVKAYVEKGADVNTQTKKDGITSLFLAAGKADEAFFFLLTEKKADIMHQAKDNSTLLHAAVMGGSEKIVRYLLKQGIDINAKGFDGNTALHVATDMLKSDIAKILIDAGADENIKNNKNKRAGHRLRALDEKITAIIMKDINQSKKETKETPSDLHKPTSLNKAIKIAVGAMRKNLPMKIDDELSLTDVKAKKSTMVLGYTLTNLTAKDISAKKLHDLLYEDIKKQVCSDNETTAMFKKGMITEYRYEGKAKKFITAFEFDAKSCGLKTNAKQLMENLKKLLKK